MPHIEVIPITSGAAPAPGWAYVPDTGYDPSKVAINPSARKRTARQDLGGAPDLTARQQTQLHKRIAELDRENQKEVVLPAKIKEGGSTPREKAGRKMTPAVRKILQSGRTFAHWLADEEALSAQRHAAGQSLAAQAAAASPAPSSSAGPPAAQSSRSKKTLASRTKRSGSTAVPSSPATPTAQAALSTSNTAAPSPAAQPAADVELLDAPPVEDDPLLRPIVPTAPPVHEVQALLAHPPLPYGAAKAAPPNPEGPPRRQFCEICGYWGRIKCFKCTARVCGLDCKRAHDETSCLRM
ncbi:putative zinc finger protein C29A3.05 [Diplodia seriata]|uniref:Putative zinc finger protein C29A3.05 n=1 Tax=Diplodia seriata TaxID=420778 RepID=A0A1S8BET8_9PEZI|nr:putative zinc finger protein C29A3.05 [Diplodia seriata]